jgi:hypothetical protein
LALTSAVPTALTAQRPPQDLHQIDGHWTAWSPPSEFPQGARVYIIQRGDTLWDLAESNYGDPYLWPQLWERNRYILDAHWIYPGDPLVLGIEATPIDEIAAVPSESSTSTSAAGAPDDEDGLRLDRFTGAPEPLGSETDVYCSGSVGPLESDFEHSIIGSEYENLTPQLTYGQRVSGVYGRADTIKYDLSTSDIVYLDGGATLGLYPGEVLTAISAGERVVHPITGRIIGRHYEHRGRVRVLSVQEETAIAEIVFSCAPIHVGDRLMPFEETPVPLGRRTPPRGINDPVSYESLSVAPAIILSGEGLVSMGQDHVVFIDRGEDSVVPGDLFTIYRESAPGLPQLVVGELAVLTVSDRAALARILVSRHTVFVGDRLSPKSR